MAVINVTLPSYTTLVQGKQITFTAPIDSTGVTGIVIDSVTYTLYDALDQVPTSKTFASDTLVSVLIDLVNTRAYINSAAGGKSAYDYALDGGYIGTEAEFISMMATMNSLNTTEEVFVATAGQTVFNLIEGTYTPGFGRLMVAINGILQPEDAYAETDNNTITFHSGLSIGDNVMIKYYTVTNVVDIDAVAHSTNHATGGSDPITPANIGAAPISSPALTGTPSAPTASAGTNTTQLATTAFVQQELSDFSSIGTIIQTIDNDLGIDYLLCNGADVNSGTYPILAAALPDSAPTVLTQYNMGGGSYDLVQFGTYYIRRHSVGIYYSTNPEGTYTYYAVSGISSVINIKIINNILFLMGLDAGGNPAIAYCSNSAAITTWATVVQVLGNTSWRVADMCFDGTYYYIVTYPTTIGSMQIFYSTNLTAWSSGGQYTIATITIYSIDCTADYIAVGFRSSSSGRVWSMTPTEARTNTTVGSAVEIYPSVSTITVYRDTVKNRWLYTVVSSGGCFVGINANNNPTLDFWMNIPLLITASVGTAYTRKFNGVWHVYFSVVGSGLYGNYLALLQDLTTQTFSLHQVPVPVSYNLDGVYKSTSKYIFFKNNTTTLFTGSCKHLPMISPTGAYAYIKAQ